MAKVLTYNFSDLDPQIGELTKRHNAEKARAEMLQKMYSTKATFPIWDLDKAVRSLRNRVARYFGSTSKYSPHQGKKEIARRLAKMTTAPVAA